MVADLVLTASTSATPTTIVWDSYAELDDRKAAHAARVKLLKEIAASRRAEVSRRRSKAARQARKKARR